ncbi:hypothetical protein Q4566_16245 [Tamlana sp. 2_MG-2023]|uniref:hypothetical protein n=1 Tax=unclassified Tamlana TaxID=2614803 RepID=UPI0026E24BA4|nr:MULTISPECIES: hypothetical protein [unclassified Tamlana]MDO6761760.1 hypothetical protein [Tamlana sp. 2_MG-2023]MDO6792521.1 hypothetical protein [Tamlana sp. 1_MG-2023]
MEKVLTPKSDQVYHLRYTTKTEFFEKYNIPKTTTKTDMLLSENKIVMDDEHMKLYGDDKNMFVVLPKVSKIYWNNSDPRLFSDSNSYKKFLDIERSLLKSSENISCSSLQKGKDRIVIIPGKEFVKATGLIKQTLVYDHLQKRVTSVENRFNAKSKVKKQLVNYDVLNYNSSKKIKEPLTYIFKGTDLMSTYEGFEIIDNRQK